MRCDECKFWNALTSIDGECRRHAPAPVAGDGDTETWWPQVNAFDWCGEFVGSSGIEAAKSVVLPFASGDDNP